MYSGKKIGAKKERASASEAHPNDFAHAGLTAARARLLHGNVVANASQDIADFVARMAVLSESLCESPHAPAKKR